MTKTRRSFTPEEQLSLIREAERDGFTDTCPQIQSIAYLTISLETEVSHKGIIFHRIDNPSNTEKPLTAC